MGLGRAAFAAGALVRMEGFETGHNGVLIYFTCADCAVEGARVAGAGGRIEKEKMPIVSTVVIVLPYDTEGNMSGLHGMK